ncbi:hypothetical protein EST38_g10032 [Candolleomyces aberdarensis]|uniref:Uncharacterized protein n=1 Tax=Candolleomyces aberdarensis TaxID=2316362 RepID=A0A4Q2D946_9AGAR|nr:hypothetical protein EST38_g10032 [Candolleomyces aberdarensis]
MPPEVLGEIFVHSLPDVLEFGAETRNHLVNIQLVCKSWQDAAQLTHKLWCVLSFDDITDVPCREVKQWFNRAGSIPKSLLIPATWYNFCTDQQSSALTTLLANLEGTLDHLSLRYKGPRNFQNLLDSLGAVEKGPASLQRRPWDALKSFTLKFDDEWDESPDTLRSIFLQLPSNITSFELHLPGKWSNAFEAEEDSESASLPLPKNLLERLSSLTLFCNWDGTEWLDAALGHCINVETLTMDFMGAFWSYDRDEPHTAWLLSSGLLLPKVRTLRLQNVCPPSIDILGVLKAPQLVELDIGFKPGNDDVDWAFSQVVLSFVERSRCEATLRLLYLRYAFMRAEELVTTLSHLPFLTHLTLEDTVMDPKTSPANLLRMLTFQLPNLEALELLELQPDYSVYPLLDFLESRRPYNHLENGEPVFTAPQATFKRLKVTYRMTQKRTQCLGTSGVVAVLRRWGGVSFDIGPILYVD